MQNNSILRILHFKEHFTPNNNHNNTISSIRHKRKELTNEYIPAD